MGWSCGGRWEDSQGGTRKRLREWVVHYPDCDDGFIGVPICWNSPNYTV